MCIYVRHTMEYRDCKYMGLLLTIGLMVVGAWSCTIEGSNASPRQTAATGGSNPAGKSDGQGADDGAGAFDGMTGGNGSNGGENDCGMLEFTAEPVAVNAYIAIDKSGSMDQSNKWVNTKAAFASFFTDPGADMLNVALRFWPDLTCGLLCSPGFCSSPEVPMGSLADPNHEQALLGAFNFKFPDGATPMEAALAGACDYAINNQPTTEGPLVVIFLTDGEPTECNTNINVIAGYAAAAHNNHDVLTFAVGLQGSNESQMNAIAQAGGTNAAYFIGSNNGQAELLAALKDIQEFAVDCRFAMPEVPDPNKTLDPTQVRVFYKKNAADPGVDIPQVANAAACDPYSGGWYFDDPQAPTQIILCEASCNMANDSNFPDGSVGVEAGCIIIAE